MGVGVGAADSSGVAEGETDSSVGAAVGGASSSVGIVDGVTDSVTGMLDSAGANGGGVKGWCYREAFIKARVTCFAFSDSRSAS